MGNHVRVKRKIKSGDLWRIHVKKKGWGDKTCLNNPQKNKINKPPVIVRKSFCADSSPEPENLLYFSLICCFFLLFEVFKLSASVLSAFVVGRGVLWDMKLTALEQR